MGMFFNDDKKSYCGKYRGVKVWSLGCMIGSNWYGVYYCTKEKNGRNYKVKDSESHHLDTLKAYIDRHIDELK